MSLHEIGTVVSLVTGVISAITTLVYLTSRLAKTELKVDTMWAFQLRRGFSEAVEKGLTSSRQLPISTPVLTEAARKAFSNLTNDLRRLYLKHDPLISDLDLVILIEQELGDRLVNEVCIPLGLRESACLVVAAILARGGTCI